MAVQNGWMVAPQVDEIEENTLIMCSFSVSVKPGLAQSVPNYSG